jgi:fibronectin type 3 domain-containing protein
MTSTTNRFICFVPTRVWMLLALLTLASAPSLSAQSGPVAAYGFNEGTGTTSADLSGNGLTATLTSGATWRSGKYGSAVSLNGTSNYVNLGNPTLLRLTGSMTVSAWINSSAFPVDDAAIVSKRNTNGYQLDTTIDEGPRTIGFKLTSNGGSSMIRYGATTLQLNTWYHVAGVYDATARTLVVYLNGQLDNGPLVGTVTGSQQNSNQNVNIGQRPGNPGTYNFAGGIDEVRIYARALSQAEIQTDMNTPLGMTADTQPPTAPAGLTATATASGTQINLSWTASTDNVGVTGYLIERCSGTGCSTFVQIAAPAGTGTTFSDTGLIPATSYSYRVRATDAAANLSGYSNVSSATTPDTQAPTAPTTLTATAAGGTQINLSWTASTDNVGVTGYLIERCSGTGCSTFGQIAAPAGTGTTFSDTGVTSGTSYSYRVRATDAAANLSAYSNVSSATPPDTLSPTAPTTLTATAASGTQINLSWTASTDNVGVLGYLIERCSGTGCATFAQIAAPAGTGTTFSDTGLTQGTS